MQDGGSSDVNSSSAHGIKRRRVGESTAENAAGPDAYREQWNEDHHGQRSESFVSNPDASSLQAKYDDQGSSSALTATGDGSQWHQADASAYPDLASYSHPYYYQQSGQGTYNSNWTTTAPQAYGGATVTSAPYSVSEQTETTTMPLFPTSTSGQVVGATEAVDDVPVFNYSDVETSTQLALNGLSTPNTRNVAEQSSAYYFDDASMHLKIQSLPILDNLATQLIHTISKASYPQIQDMMHAPDSEDGQAYKTLKNLFDQTRRVYSRETPFIDAIAIQMFQPTQQEIIRKANIATFISSILGAHDVSFFHLNEFFMETFVPLGHRLLKWQGAIYLELKTQTYISALMNSDGDPEEMLDELFPPDLDAQILTRHPDAPSLSPSEQDFIDRSRARKSYLLAEPKSDESMKELPKKYQWSDFVREFASCITKNVDGIMNVPLRSQATANNSKGVTSDLSALNGNGNNNAALAAVQNLSLHAKSGAGSGSTSKSGNAASAIRQPWTRPEEDALLAGLERVNGPHWSQILALYGRGGSVSEVLKDRNQVQLKDKARNLKLWYLKTGKEVPVALRGVTGELRKRGGARARAALGMLDEEDAAAGGPQKDGDANDADESEKPTAFKSGRKAKKGAKKG